MDPNETLRRLRQLVVDDELGKDVNPTEFAELFQALDDWIQAGGFLPDDWQEVS